MYLTIVKQNGVYLLGCLPVYFISFKQNWLYGFASLFYEWRFTIANTRRFLNVTHSANSESQFLREV